jgi:S1-C subfamily serine protease
MKNSNKENQKNIMNNKLTRYSAIGAVFVAVSLILIPLLNSFLTHQIEPDTITDSNISYTSTVPATISPTDNPTPVTLESLTPNLSRSIVHITAREKGNFTVPETGTGIIISQDGYIITNAHVVMNGNVEDQIIVTLTIGDRQIERYAYIKGIMPCDDIALIDVQGNDYIPIPSSPLIPIGLGSEVFLLGYGHSSLITDGFSLRFAQGTISRPKTSFSPFPMLIEHSIALLPADSGSPLFDRNGQLIAINFAMDISGRGGNIAYAIDYQRV